MKTVFVGNHKNEWLLQGAIHFAQKNIPDLSMEICYTPADVTQWASSLGKFVRKLDEEYVLLMLDDYWVQEVDVGLLEKGESFINTGFVKVDLSGDRLQFPHHVRLDSGWVQSEYYARYRTSLQAAIWKTEYLLKFCREGWTPWDFEIEGSKMARDDCQIVGCEEVILGSPRPAIRYINVLRRGEWYGKFDF